MAFTLTSPAFRPGDRVPVKYTCGGEDVSLPLEWQGVPVGTKSLALICLDPDAPSGVFHHWAIFDIPPDMLELAEGVARTENLAGGIRQAANDFGKIGYSGPCPPRGHGVHHYHFRLFALNAAHLDAGRKPDSADVLAAAQEHTVAVAEIVGTFER